MAGKRQRGNPPRRAGEAEAIEIRRKESIRLRLIGYGFRDIAEQTGVSLRQAWLDVQAVREQERAEAKIDATSERELEVDRAEHIIRTHMTTVDDPKSALVILKAMERKAKLQGLDAPEKLEHSSSVVSDYLSQRYGFGVGANGAVPDPESPTRH